MHAARALTITRPALSAGFFDDAPSAMIIDAWSTVLNIIGGQYKERWPDEESRIIFLSTVFTYQERLTALTFLYGNLRDADLVHAAVHPQIAASTRATTTTRAASSPILRAASTTSSTTILMCSPATGSSSAASSTRAARRPARSRARCMRGMQSACACSARRGGGRRSPSSARSWICRS